VTSAPAVLEAYCYFIPFLGLNGIAEAFVQAVANEQEIARMSWAMSLWSAVYIAACFFFTVILQQKEVGLIQANMVNMACRIIWSGIFIYNYFKGRAPSEVKPMRDAILPSVTACLTFGTCALLLRALRIEETRGIKNVVYAGLWGVGSVLISLSSVILSERAKLRSAVNALRTKQAEKKQQ